MGRAQRVGRRCGYPLQELEHRDLVPAECRGGALTARGPRRRRGHCHSLQIGLQQSGVDPADVIGVGIDFTACTMMPVKADGTLATEANRYVVRTLVAGWHTNGVVYAQEFFQPATP